MTDTTREAVARPIYEDVLRDNKRKADRIRELIAENAALRAEMLAAHEALKGYNDDD